MKSEYEIENKTGDQNARDQFENSFDVPLSTSQVWRVLSDVERVASCFPGLELTKVDDYDYEGTFNVALGPAHLSFAIEGGFDEIDPVARTAQLSAHGVAAGGVGAADAIISFRLEPIGSGTTVFVTTDLALTGPAAWYGSSIRLIQGTAREIMYQ